MTGVASRGVGETCSGRNARHVQRSAVSDEFPMNSDVIMTSRSRCHRDKNDKSEVPKVGRKYKAKLVTKLAKRISNTNR